MDGCRATDAAAPSDTTYIGQVELAVLIPVKRFSAAKGRLRGAVDDEHRALLAEWMATQVIDAVAELPTFIACDDEGVREWATGHGAEVVWGPDLGLNRAVDDGVNHLLELGARHVIVSHADLPRPSGLREVATRGAITLVPDRRRDGTNVMSFPCEAPIRAAYGAGSFERHLRQATEQSLVPVEVRHDRDLSLDVDTLDDLNHPLIREVLPSWLPMIRDSHRS